MNDLELLRTFDPGGSESAAGREAARDRLAAAMSGHPERPARRESLWRSRAVQLAGVAAAAAVIALAVVLPGRDGGTPPSGDRILYTEAVVTFPNDTASDVVSYADMVAVVTAVAEAEIPDSAPPARAAAGEGTINRRLTLRVDDVLWRRSGSPVPPATFTAVWWGWVLHEHQRSKSVAQGAPWIEVGSQYVMPIAFDQGEFSPLQPLAVFPYAGSAVAPTEGQDTPLARDLAGAPSAAVAAVFGKATPDPVAARHMNLQPTERLRAVIEERRSR